MTVAIDYERRQLVRSSDDETVRIVTDGEPKQRGEFVGRLHWEHWAMSGCRPCVGGPYRDDVAVNGAICLYTETK